MAMVSSLGYVVLRVADLDAWLRFGRDVVGFHAEAIAGGQLALRMDEMRYRLLLEAGEEDDFHAAGWQVRGGAELRGLVKQIEDSGREIVLDKACAIERQVEELWACLDPNGFRHEFFCGPMVARDDAPFKSAILHDVFVTGAFGLGHVVLRAKNLAEGKEFYAGPMGLLYSGNIRPTGRDVEFQFFHAESGRYRSMAVASTFPGDKRTPHPRDEDTPALQTMGHSRYASLRGLARSNHSFPGGARSDGLIEPGIVSKVQRPAEEMRRWSGR